MGDHNKVESGDPKEAVDEGSEDEEKSKNQKEKSKGDEVKVEEQGESGDEEEAGAQEKKEREGEENGMKDQDPTYQEEEEEEENEAVEEVGNDEADEAEDNETNGEKCDCDDGYGVIDAGECVFLDWLRFFIGMFYDEVEEEEVSAEAEKAGPFDWFITLFVMLCSVFVCAMSFGPAM